MPHEEILIADIDKELEKLREAEESQHQIRASLFNLILYNNEARRTAHFQEFVQAIIDIYPCRIVFIQSDSDPSHNYIRVSVSSVATSKGEVSIACDQIHVEVTASQLHRVPYLILPHLLADLPIYLLWGQDPTQPNELLTYFQRYATRIIFDSECAKNLPHFGAALSEMIASGKIEISDMNWVAIRGWRDVMARTFDNQEKIQQLHGAKNVQILYNGTRTAAISHPEIQALYLQAWLAAQMQWRFIEASLTGEVKTVKYHNDGQIEIKLLSREEQTTQPGTILAIDVETYGKRLFSIARKERLNQVVVHLSTQEECAMPFSLPLQDSKRGPTFLRDLLYRGAGSHYKNTLGMIAQIQGAT
jgi:glucose-6-phosphate dehydrogenase assembly protein OpcA